MSAQQRNGDGLIGYLSHTGDVMIATTLKAGGEIRTEIWAVVVNGAGYIRNGFGETSKWYRRAQRTHHTAFINGDHRYPVTIENVDDEAMITAVDEAYKKKYRGPGLRAVVSPFTRSRELLRCPRDWSPGPVRAPRE